MLGLGVLAAVLQTACATSTRGTIGAILGRQVGGRTFVRDTPQHLAAFQAGIRPGDELLFVDGREVSSLSDEELRAALHGRIGEKVSLTLVRGGDEILRVSLARSAAESYAGL